MLTRTSNSYDSSGNLLSVSQLVGGTTYLTTAYSYYGNGPPPIENWILLRKRSAGKREQNLSGLLCLHYRN